MEAILNVQLEDRPWTQATLPTAFGGLGIRRVKDVSLPAFLGSAHGVSVIVSQIFDTSVDADISHLQESLSFWNDQKFHVSVSPSCQRSWDVINIKQILNEFLVSSNVYDTARINAFQHNESNAWLNALPSKQIGTFMDSNSIRICIALRLGSTICRPHRCVCGTEVNRFGIHGLACQKSAGRFSRHAELNKIICQSLRSINVPATLEPPGMFRSDGKRADGLTLVPWSNGKFLVWDSTCCDKLADSYVRSSSIAAGRAAELAGRKKHEKYREIKENGYIFNAFAVETMGTLSREAVGLANEIGSKLIEYSGDRRAKNFLFQRISIAIQRANSASIMGSIPPETKLDEIYYI